MGLTSSGAGRSGSLSRLPCAQAWRAPSADVSRCKHIVVRPVSTAYLPRQANAKKSRARDADTGKVIATVADRRGDWR